VVIAGIVGVNNGDWKRHCPLSFWVFSVGRSTSNCIGCYSIGNTLNYIPYPVVSGFMTAIGVSISSLPKFYPGQ